MTDNEQTICTNIKRMVAQLNRAFEIAHEAGLAVHAETGGRCRSIPQVLFVDVERVETLLHLGPLPLMPAPSAEDEMSLVEGEQ